MLKIKTCFFPTKNESIVTLLLLETTGQPELEMDGRFKKVSNLHKVSLKIFEFQFGRPGTF